MNKIYVNVMIVVALIVAAFLTMNSVTSNTGMMSYLIKYLGVALALLAFVKPKTGAYILLFEAFLVDAIKRYAVYYGTTSIDTVIEVMVVQMLAVSALILAVLIKLLTREIKFRKYVFSFLILGLVAGGIKIFLSYDEGLTSAVKSGYNLGAYIALAFVFYHLFVDLDLKIKPFFNVMLCLGVLSSIVALRQSYSGFSDVEDYYMHTFLSPVASGHYMRALDVGINPRGFGLASGVMNFVSMSGLAIYAWFSLCGTKRIPSKILYFLCYVIVCVALFEVRMKTGLVIALFAPFALLIAKYSKVLYACTLLGIVSFVAVILNSVKIRNSISEIDHAFRGTIGLGDEYSIQTFEARLHSYSQMLELKNWTAFGVDHEVDAHDVITYFLMQFGFIPLFVALFTVGAIYIFLVRQRKRIDSSLRSAYMGFLVMFGLLFMANIVGGSNLHTNPVNFVLWASLAAVLAIGWGDIADEVDEEDSESYT